MIRPLLERPRTVTFDDVHRRAIAAGVAIECGPASEPWGVRRFYIRDPFARVSAAQERQAAAVGMASTPATRREASHAFHVECHFFAVAAYKLLEFRDWVLTFGLCNSVDFAEIARFSSRDIRDLRNMREHVVDYFRGAGNTPNRWMVKTPEYRADASAVVGTMIGGRLDWIAFGKAAERLLPLLLAAANPLPAEKGKPSRVN